jgi:hypothetical protein
LGDNKHTVVDLECANKVSLWVSSLIILSLESATLPTRKGGTAHVFFFFFFFFFFFVFVFVFFCLSKPFWKAKALSCCSKGKSEEKGRDDSNVKRETLIKQNERKRKEEEKDPKKTKKKHKP